MSKLIEKILKENYEDVVIYYPAMSKIKEGIKMLKGIPSSAISSSAFDTLNQLEALAEVLAEELSNDTEMREN